MKRCGSLLEEKENGPIVMLDRVYKPGACMKPSFIVCSSTTLAFSISALPLWHCISICKFFSFLVLLWHSLIKHRLSADGMLHLLLQLSSACCSTCTIPN